MLIFRLTKLILYHNSDKLIRTITDVKITEDYAISVSYRITLKLLSTTLQQAVYIFM